MQLDFDLLRAMNGSVPAHMRGSGGTRTQNLELTQAHGTSSAMQIKHMNLDENLTALDTHKFAFRLHLLIRFNFVAYLAGLPIKEYIWNNYVFCVNTC